MLSRPLPSSRRTPYLSGMENATPTPDIPAPGQPSPGTPTGNGRSAGEMIITRPRAPADFDLQSSFSPAGDQPTAIKELVEGIRNGERDQVLLGVTGSVSYTHLTLPTITGV